jgi:hypothetical protein
MDDLTTRYNYDSFTVEKYSPWMNFDSSPSLGDQAPDFPLWYLEDRSEIKLSQIFADHLYTVVEFGSFT